MRSLLALFLLPAVAFATTTIFDDLRRDLAAVEREYDVEQAEALLPAVQQYAEANPSDETHFLLAELAAVIAELNRMDYETEEEMDTREQRLLGRRIDEVAQIGLDALNKLPDSSEKFRIMSDLYATMIRSKYKGSKYGNEMERAAEKALAMDPSNPDAYVTVAKKPLFAKEKHGGDLEMSLTLLNRALQLDPEHEKALIFRGIAFEKLNQLDRAVEDWNTVLEQNPHSRPAISNMKRVKDIER